MNDFEKRINLNFPLEILSKEICKNYNLGEFIKNELIKIGYEDYNYILTTNTGKYVVKVFSNLRTDEDCQNLADRASIPKKFNVSSPNIFDVNGKNLYIINLKNIKFRLIVMEYIDGKDFYTLNKLPTINDLKYIGRETAKLNKIQFEPPFIYDCWAIINFENEYNKNIKYVKDHEKELIEKAYKDFKLIDFSKLKYGFVHGDIIETNVICDKNRDLYFIDFSVSNYLPRIMDLAVTICDLCLDLNDIEKSKQRISTYLNSYEQVFPLSQYEKKCLSTMIKCHQAITVLETTKEKFENNNLSQENLKFLNKGKLGLKIIYNNELI